MSTPALSGKTALVTGGARRIGRSIALALAQAGADVAFTFRTSQAAAAETAAAITALGRPALAVPCDVRSEQSVREAIHQTVSTFGHLDILVNNAAIFETAPLDSLTLDQWNAIFETNTRGPFLVSREALPHLRAARGRIIHIGSLGGEQAWAAHAHYAASKAALHSLTRSMAKAFAPDVAVNCVAPGWIDPALVNPASVSPILTGTPSTGLNDRTATEAASAQRFADRTPMRRNGSADDVAQAVLFFATGPSFITGQILTVDGGLGLV
jgi:3-oxoacyl-[acyl-carrier protein] reductase/pteridine reductase